MENKEIQVAVNVGDFHIYWLNKETCTGHSDYWNVHFNMSTCNDRLCYCLGHTCNHPLCSLNPNVMPVQVSLDVWLLRIHHSEEQQPTFFCCGCWFGTSQEPFFIIDIATIGLIWLNMPLRGISTTLLEGADSISNIKWAFRGGGFLLSCQYFIDRLTKFFCVHFLLFWIYFYWEIWINFHQFLLTRACVVTYIKRLEIWCQGSNSSHH